MITDFWKLRLRFSGVFHAASILVCVATVAGFAGGAWWILDDAASFRVQYLVWLILAVLVAVVRRERGLAALYAGGALLNLLVIAPLYFGGRESRASAGRPSVRVLLLNVHTANQQYAKVISLVRTVQPDVILLEEIDAKWWESLAPLRDSHPFICARPREDNMGIGLWAKSKFETAEIVYLGEAEVPSVLATLEFGGKKLTVMGTHPLPPGNAEYARLRNQQLEVIARRLSQPVATDGIVLLGDLNASPWSDAFRRLVKVSRLRDSERGFGLQPSWPTMLWALRIPIDHCLVSSNLVVVNRQIGPAVGSDHFPLIVDLAFQED
jgi:endonuclease/exonuclease/phosphatase (EEP) superfamily protein YafD